MKPLNEIQHPLFYCCPKIYVIAVEFYGFQLETAQGLGDLKFCLLPTAINSRPKKYFHFTERQLPPGRDGVEWDSDDGYAEVCNYQVDQQQMIVSSQLKHREGVQCMIQPHIIENEGLLNPVIARHKLQDKDKEFQSKPPFLSRDTGEGCRG